MGRQIRKYHPWQGLVYSHLGHNYYIFRQYKWQSYNSHPKQTTGCPFKTRSKYGRVNPSVLNNPEPLKYHIPIPFAFVPVDPYNTVNTITGEFYANPSDRKTSLVSREEFKFTDECQKTLLNLNRCLKNTGGNQCNYYQNYLYSNCKN